MKVAKIHFEEQLAQVIWDDSAKALAIELRDKEKQKLKLVYLELQSGKQWLIEEELSWWFKLQGCSQGKLILNGFEDPGLPLTKGVYVFDAESGQKSWARPSSHFLYQTSGGIWVEENEEKFFVRLDTAKITSPPSTEDHKQYEKLLDSSYQACRVIYRLDEEFPFLQTKIEKLRGHKSEEYLDHLIFEGKEIFSYSHRNPSGGWDQELTILKEGETLWARKTGSQLKGIAWSTFFIWRKFLIWQEAYQSICFSDLG
ncbi:MAG: DUF4905 domain-containing protein [Bacteroidota bacterium]